MGPICNWLGMHWQFWGFSLEQKHDLMSILQSISFLKWVFDWLKQNTRHGLIPHILDHTRTHAHKPKEHIAQNWKASYLFKTISAKTKQNKTDYTFDDKFHSAESAFYKINKSILCKDPKECIILTFKTLMVQFPGIILLWSLWGLDVLTLLSTETVLVVRWEAGCVQSCANPLMVQ